MATTVRIFFLAVSLVIQLPNSILAATIGTIVDSNCGSAEFTTPIALGERVTQPLNCSLFGHPNQASVGVVGESTNHSFHGHRGVWTAADTPAEQKITTSPNWTAQGARLEVALAGTIHRAMGNPNDLIGASATLEADFANGFVKAKAELPFTTLKPGQTTLEFAPGINCPTCFKFAQNLTGVPHGDHISTLTVFLFGPGQLNMSGSGTSEITAPEPATWLTMIIGIIIAGMPAAGRIAGRLSRNSLR